MYTRIVSIWDIFFRIYLYAGSPPSSCIVIVFCAHFCHRCRWWPSLSILFFRPDHRQPHLHFYAMVRLPLCVCYDDYFYFFFIIGMWYEYLFGSCSSSCFFWFAVVYLIVRCLPSSIWSALSSALCHCGRFTSDGTQRQFIFISHYFVFFVLS